MAKSFVDFKMEGLDKMLKGIDQYAKDVQEDVDLELRASADTIAAQAQVKAPVDAGGLHNAISTSRNGDMDYEVVAQKHYAPYVEFGTGTLVDVPSGLEEYAIQFKGKGIKQVNLPARPYLFPAYEAERVKLIDRLKKILGAK
jgi:HK97 gp10 family phage protein